MSPRNPLPSPSTKVGDKEKAGVKKAVEPEFVRKTDEEWAKVLNPAVFRVTRWKETEPAFSGRYATGHYRGTFICACCGAELFYAQHKFDSGTGWPSFWRPVANNAIQRAIDNSEAEQRIEVMCRRCGAASRPCLRRQPRRAHGITLLHQLARPQAQGERWHRVQGRFAQDEGESGRRGSRP